MAMNFILVVLVTTLQDAKKKSPATDPVKDPAGPTEDLETNEKDRGKKIMAEFNNALNGKELDKIVFS